MRLKRGLILFGLFLHIAAGLAAGEGGARTADARGVPSRISYRSREGEMTFTFAGNGKRVDEKLRLLPNATAENMLALRSLRLEDGGAYEFDLIQTDKLPRLEAYRMCFQLVGKEEVTVPAGTFRCLTLRFSFRDWRRFSGTPSIT
jgi:hypothetical protein